MPTLETTNQTQVNSPDAVKLAFSEMQQNCEHNFFFQKLANSYGIVPRDQNEAVLMLDMADELYQDHQRELLKQADARSMFLHGAADRLSRRSGGSGPRHIKQAVDYYTSDPKLMASAMLLTQAFEAAGS